MVCHGQHTYVYSQVLLQVLSQEPKGGSNMKRLSQEIIKCAQKKYEKQNEYFKCINHCKFFFIFNLANMM